MTSQFFSVIANTFSRQQTHVEIYSSVHLFSSTCRIWTATTECHLRISRKQLNKKSCCFKALASACQMTRYS